MKFFDIFPTYHEAPYSYLVVPALLLSSIVGLYHKPYRHALVLHPYEIYRGKRWFTLLGSAFIHRNWLHLLNNMWVVYGLGFDMFGCIAKETGQLRAYVLTPILFVALVVLPNMVQTWVKRDDFMFTAMGASGLAFGLYGYSAFYFPLEKMHSRIFPFIHNATHSWMVGLVILFLLSRVRRQSIVNVRLHISAYLIGSVLALLVRPEAWHELITQSH